MTIFIKRARQQARLTTLVICLVCAVTVSCAPKPVVPPRSAPAHCAEAVPANPKTPQATARRIEINRMLNPLLLFDDKPATRVTDAPDPQRTPRSIRRQHAPNHSRDGK